LNIVNVIGRYFGLTHYTVELKNIVIGDLPWIGPGDFFLQVECESNPPISSSVAQSKQPKVVHFPEVVTLHLRWSYFEQQVRITVRELGLLGSTQLCSVRVRACDIVDWSHSDPAERTKRLEMKVDDLHEHVVTTPWIFIEFDEPREVRDLDHFHHNTSVVRTASRTGHYQDDSVSQFKHNHALLDPNGNPMHEPLDEDIEGIRRCREYVVGMSSFCNVVVSITVVVYLFLRGYVYSCDQRYRWLAMASLLNKTFPISNHDVSRMVETCEERMGGTGIQEGTDPCRPTPAMVADVCLSHFPEVQPRPTAFNKLFESLGMPMDGVPCSEHLCEHFDAVQKTDAACVCGCTLLVMFALGFWCRTSHVFDRFKSRVVQQRAAEMFEGLGETPRSVVAAGRAASRRRQTP
jgi:hypothetical protein